MSSAFAKSIASDELDVRLWSHSASESSIRPLQSSSKLFPSASNANGLTLLGALHSVESQQSPPHVVKPSWSRSSSLSTAPSQLLSTASPHTSVAGITSPRQLPHCPASVHV